MNTAARLTFRTTETAVVDKPAEEPDHGVLSSRWTVWAGGSMPPPRLRRVAFPHHVDSVGRDRDVIR